MSLNPMMTSMIARKLLRSVVAVVLFALAAGGTSSALHAAEAAATAPAAPERATVITVVGAPGEEDFGESFHTQADLWTKACEQAGAHQIMIGLDPTSATTDYDRLKQALAAEPKEGTTELWVVLIGHGTFDSKEAKFNLRGPDVSANEFADWLKPFRRPLALIDTSASSAPFLGKLSGPNRVIVTATRSGAEQNYTRFGRYFAQALTDASGDLDKDGEVSVLEAFLSASRRTGEFYKTEGRLSTEHALIDDNGDGLGTPADWFKGTHATKRARDGAALDGARAQQFILVRSATERELSPDQRARRDELEIALAKLRDAKPKLAEADYYSRLEKVLLQLAAIYENKS